MKDVAIIDYKMSNLHSVEAACQKVGLSYLTTSNHEKIMNSKAAILPGVGAFGTAMSFLKKTGLDCCIKDFVETGKPFLGICLGMQLLFENSDEFGLHQGLGLIKGRVKKFQFKEKDYPNTALFYEESVSLPIYPDLSYKDQKYVTQSIKEIIKL